MVCLGGIPGSYLGGHYGDVLEAKYPRVKGYIAGFGALSALPFIWLCYLPQWNFYFSILMLYCAYFTAEAWYGPSHAIINVIFPPKYQGVGKFL